MKKLISIMIVLSLMAVTLVSCGNKQPEVLKAGDDFSVTGMVEYFDEPSDIGNEYCSVTGNVKIKYEYVDIYGEKSSWSSETFFTQGDDTVLLKDYVGKKVTVSGVFAAECHGIPYITNIEIK